MKNDDDDGIYEDGCGECAECAREALEEMLLYVIGAMHELEDAGLLSFSWSAGLAPGGIAKYDQVKMKLRSEGRLPDRSDVLDCLDAFRRVFGLGIEQRVALVIADMVTNLDASLSLGGPTDTFTFQ